MRLILNGINGRYLREITDSDRGRESTDNAAKETEFVEAAVAYATDDRLFAWCWKNRIPLRFWGRFDDGVPVGTKILQPFLANRSANFTCKLVTHFHPKVIWWHGYGAYIGSANLSDAAWHSNIEAGTFFEEEELLRSAMDRELRDFFDHIDEHASPLTEELFKAIEEREKELQRITEQDGERRKRFRSIPSVHQWQGLLDRTRKSALEAREKAFLDEWHRTLQILRDIGDTVAKDENRPKWLPATVPAGAQADRFLHAYYENYVIGDGRRSRYAELYEENKTNPDRALQGAIDWWRSQAAAPSNEDRTLLEWAPFLRDKLSRDNVLTLTEPQFAEVCERVWSIRDHARRVSNETLELPGDRRHGMETKTPALAHFLYGRRSRNGSSVLQVIHHVLYGGVEDAVPTRLWEATTPGPWRIEHLGISALGELVGWALPNRFPPRNNRTSKALRALGNQVAFLE